MIVTMRVYRLFLTNICWSPSSAQEYKIVPNSNIKCMTHTHIHIKSILVSVKNVSIIYFILNFDSQFACFMMNKLPISSSYKMMIVWQQTQQQQEQSLFKMSTIELSFCYQQITMIIMQMIKYQNSINNISMMIKLNLNFQNSKIIPDFIPVYHCHWFVFFLFFFC